MHLFDKIEPVVRATGYRLWWVHWLRGQTLQVFIDAPDGITLEDCEKVSRELSFWLDVADVELGLPSTYSLQVSSPGADRSLYIRDHYQQYCGWLVLVRLHRARDGKRTYKGVLAKVTDVGIALETGEAHQSFDWGEIKETRLVYEPDTDPHSRRKRRETLKR